MTRVLDAAERARERLAERRVRGDQSALIPDGDWEASLHRLLRSPWPCAEREAFAARWAEALAGLEQRGLAVGRGTYAGWDDADRGVARAAWCLVRHLRPRVVVETGVARGLTTRLLLQALGENGAGRLWSIDLPPWRHGSQVAGQVAAAVPRELMGRWTLVEGSTRRRLPGLLRDLGTIDLFVHDSSHSYRNMSFELAQAWDAVRPGGFLLIDDVHRNDAFHESRARFGPVASIACRADDGQAMFGLIQKPLMPTAAAAAAPRPEAPVR